MKNIANEHTHFEVILVTSQSGDILEEYKTQMNFFLLDEKSLHAASVEELNGLLGGDPFNPLNFRNRLIPTSQPIPTIDLKNSSDGLGNQYAVSVQHEPVDTTAPKIRPDGIIVDLFLDRFPNDWGHVKKVPNGLGIVAWAVRHSLPVGLIINDNLPETRHSNFWFESVIDSLQSYPNGLENHIVTGDYSKVMRGTRNVILKQYSEISL